MQNLPLSLKTFEGQAPEPEGHRVYGFEEFFLRSHMVTRWTRGVSRVLNDRGILTRRKAVLFVASSGVIHSLFRSGELLRPRSLKTAGFVFQRSEQFSFCAQVFVATGASQTCCSVHSMQRNEETGCSIPRLPLRKRGFLGNTGSHLSAVNRKRCDRATLFVFGHFSEVCLSEASTRNDFKVHFN
ncbi:hypothetical protein TGMAS_413100 [Toxoplasma gondii MAS]|uniref:Uncharacterized protein n=1 Tax=Toxoplasma gondii MAS TaxID=943118 RepID=A0A086QX04_TOXGO|nr:hypothetical protein TGMAS_413100 [Toxoplasma gondii MAS]